MIIPAAGLSTRYPDKLLLKTGNTFQRFPAKEPAGKQTFERFKQTVIETTVSNFVNFPMEIIIVLGHNIDKFASVLNHRFERQVRIIENSEYRSGMGTSLKAGVIASNPNTDYFGFCLGDKPFVKTETIGHLLETLERQHPPILAPAFNGVFGHPNFFSKKYRDKFTSLKTDIGGRDILQSERQNVLTIPVNDAGVITDMDNYLKIGEYGVN